MSISFLRRARAVMMAVSWGVVIVLVGIQAGRPALAAPSYAHSNLSWLLLPPAPLPANPDTTDIAESEYLVNANFEGYHTGWTEIPSNGIIFPGSYLPVWPHGGYYAAWLGGSNNNDDRLYQDVALPAAISSIVFRIWYYVSTSEHTREYDWLTVRIVNPGNENQVYATILELDASPPTNDWVNLNHQLSAAEINSVGGFAARSGWHRDFHRWPAIERAARRGRRHRPGGRPRISQFPRGRILLVRAHEKPADLLVLSDPGSNGRWTRGCGCGRKGNWGC